MTFDDNKTNLSVCLSVCLLACLSACLPVCLPACLPVCLPACLPACLSFFIRFICYSYVGRLYTVRPTQRYVVHVRTLNTVWLSKFWKEWKHYSIKDILQIPSTILQHCFTNCYSVTVNHAVYKETVEVADSHPNVK